MVKIHIKPLVLRMICDFVFSLLRLVINFLKKITSTCFPFKRSAKMFSKKKSDPRVALHL